MTVEKMRAAILKVYPNDTWKRRVFRMHDDQVIAIYHNFLERGKLKKKPKTSAWALSSKSECISGVQMSLF